MQEKYLGDTPDFAKYALLKALCGSDLRLGINWYLTLPHEVDGIDNKDGETRHHASSSKSYRAIDQTLWEQLGNFQHSDDRSISTFESSKVLPLRTKYFSEPLSFAGLQSKSEKLQARSDWVQRGLRKLKNTDLVFIDPDTGMEIPSKERHEKKGPKYAFYDELVPLIKRNQTLVLIQFVDRSGTEIQAQKVTKNIRTHTGFAGKLDIVRAKAGRAILFFILHSKKNSDRIISRLEKFLSGPALDRFYSVRIQEQSKNSKKLIKKAMAEGQKDHLRKLIKDFERVQTIQDVGSWLINDSLDPLPPKHVAVLRQWLETHNELTIKQSRRGNPHSEIRNAFLYITRLHRDAGMSIEAACNWVAEALKLETDPADLRRMYDNARTPETRHLNEVVKATGAFSNKEAQLSKVQKAGQRRKKAKEKQKKAKNRQKRTQKP